MTASIPVEQPLQECVECGYSLEGLAEEGQCPECGRAFTDGECCVAGLSPILLFTPMGCAWAFLLPLILVVPMLFWFGQHSMALFLLFADVMLLAGFLVARREVSRMPIKIVGGPHLLLLRNELRLRHGRNDALTSRWENVSHIAMRQELPGLWRLQFELSSVAFRPKFYFRAMPGPAQALYALIEQRAAEARRR